MKNAKKVDFKMRSCFLPYLFNFISSTTEQQENKDEKKNYFIFILFYFKLKRKITQSLHNIKLYLCIYTSLF